MKKIVLFSFLVSTLFSCNPNTSSQSKNTVDALSNDWQATTKEVQRFSNDLEASFKRCNVVRDSMGLPPGSLQRLGNQARQESTTLLKNMTEYRRSYIDLGRDFNVFFKDWEQKTQELDQVANVVNYNQPSKEDIPGKISTLQTSVNEANTKLSQWTTQLDTLKTKVEADFASFNEKTAAIR